MLEKALDNLDASKYAALVTKEKEAGSGNLRRRFLTISRLPDVPVPFMVTKVWDVYTGTWFPNYCLLPRNAISMELYEGADPVVVGKIKDHYFEIKAGIGLNKSPELYGAFPTDAYSHTPGNAGVQQPGMTGHG